MRRKSATVADLPGKLGRFDCQEWDCHGGMSHLAAWYEFIRATDEHLGDRWDSDAYAFRFDTLRRCEVHP